MPFVWANSFFSLNCLLNYKYYAQCRHEVSVHIDRYNEKKMPNDSIEDCTAFREKSRELQRNVEGREQNEKLKWKPQNG